MFFATKLVEVNRKTPIGVLILDSIPRIPILDIVPPELPMRTASPGEVVVDTHQDRDDVHPGSPECIENDRQVFGIPVGEVVEGPVPICVEDDPRWPVGCRFQAFLGLFGSLAGAYQQEHGQHDRGACHEELGTLHDSILSIYRIQIDFR